MQHKKIALAIITFILALSLVSSVARLPEVGSDSGQWGTVLNEYLNVSHNATGHILNDSLSSLQILNDSLTDIDISDSTNLTLGQKITFSLGEIIDNILDGWIRINGGLNVTGNASFDSSTLFVDSTNDKVGIGTTNPGSPLEVVGNITTNGGAYAFLFGDGSSYIQRVSNDLYLKTSNIISIPSNNVGIGTTSPTVRLDIIGTSNGSLRLADTTTNATNKLGRIVGRPYTNTDIDFLAFDIRGLTSSNEINYGGGSGLLNAVTLHAFYTAANSTTLTGTERVRIDSSGNVGIGTTIPDTTFNITQIVGRTLKINSSTTRAVLSLEGTGTALGADIFLVDNDAPADGRWMVIRTSNGSTSFLPHTDSGALAFNSIVINHSSGKVGIGTTTPAHPLNINGSVHDLYSQHRESSSIGFGQEMSYWFDTADGTDAQYASIYSEVISNANAAQRGAMELRVVNDGAEVSAIRINSSGNVGIGTTNTVSPLYVSGAAGIDTTGASNKWTLRLHDKTTSAAGIGASILFQGYKSSANATGNFAGIAGLKENAADGNEQGYLALYTVPSSGIITERMRIDSAGAIGINTTTPDSMLDVEGSSATTYTATSSDGQPHVATVRIMNTNTTQNQFSQILFGNRNSGFGIARIVATEVGGGDNVALTFVTEGSDINERMRITGSGIIGINTTSPRTVLDVVGMSSSGGGIMLDAGATDYGFITSAGNSLHLAQNAYYNGTGWFSVKAGAARVIQTTDGYPLYISTNSSTLPAENRVISFGAPLMAITDTGLVGIGTTTSLSSLTVHRGSSNNIINVRSDSSTYWTGLGITPAASTTWYVYTDRNDRLQINNALSTTSFFTIEDTGEVGIGTSSPPDALSVIGNVNASGCFELANGTVVGGSCVSDRSTKENIAEYSADTSKLLALNPKQFEFKGEMTNVNGSSKKIFTHIGKNGKAIEMEMPQGVQTGFIADEVQQFYPEWVSEDENGLKRVTYGMNWLFELWGQNQEQQKEISKLNEKNEAIKRCILNGSTLAEIQNCVAAI